MISTRAEGKAGHGYIRATILRSTCKWKLCAFDQ